MEELLDPIFFIPFLSTLIFKAASASSIWKNCLILFFLSRLYQLGFSRQAVHHQFGRIAWSYFPYPISINSDFQGSQFIINLEELLDPIFLILFLSTRIFKAASASSIWKNYLILFSLSHFYQLWFLRQAVHHQFGRITWSYFLYPISINSDFQGSQCIINLEELLDPIFLIPFLSTLIFKAGSASSIWKNCLILFFLSCFYQLGFSRQPVHHQFGRIAWSYFPYPISINSNFQGRQCIINLEELLDPIFLILFLSTLIFKAGSASSIWKNCLILFSLSHFYQLGFLR